MKASAAVFFLAISMMMMTGCPKDDSTDPDELKPTISVIAPISAKVDEVVRIVGSDFGTTQDSGYVSFNGVKATDYISWSDKEIKVRIPVGATDGKVFVYSNGLRSNEVDYSLEGMTYGTVKDIDGNVYKTVKIGNQVWMAENLRVTRYCNGDTITQIADSADWINSKLNMNGSWCNYENSFTNGKVYGKLYNINAVIDGRRLAPEGWHIPDNEEWSALGSYLGGLYKAGGMMKATGTVEGGDGLWKSPNTGGTNACGFSAIPGGMRSVWANSYFEMLGKGAYWWSSSSVDENYCWGWSVSFGGTYLSKGRYLNSSGLSVRCVKD